MQTDTPHADKPDTEAIDGFSLPMIVRRAPIRLHDVEGRVRRDSSFARSLASEPGFSARLAAAIRHRDPEARRRFPSADALRVHLDGLSRG